MVAECERKKNDSARHKRNKKTAATTWNKSEQKINNLGRILNWMLARVYE